MPDNLFEKPSPLGYTVCCSKKAWEDHIISETGHPIMKNNLPAVGETIESPDAVYGSNQWPDRDVYFKRCASATYGDSMYTKVIKYVKNKL